MHQLHRIKIETFCSFSLHCFARQLTCIIYTITLICLFYAEYQFVNIHLNFGEMNSWQLKLISIIQQYLRKFD